MNEHHKVNYIEIPVSNIPASKHFFTEVFGWTFQDFGPEYCGFVGEGIDGGFFQSDHNVSTENGSVLVVLYSKNLEQSVDEVKKSGGSISAPIFSFPGGRRFHFKDPSNNEFAIWSE